jgi:hypothetical protein
MNAVNLLVLAASEQVPLAILKSDILLEIAFREGEIFSWQRYHYEHHVGENTLDEYTYFTATIADPDEVSLDTLKELLGHL